MLRSVGGRPAGELGGTVRPGAARLARLALGEPTRRQAGVPRVLLPEHELHETERHADSGRAEAPRPSEHLALSEAAADDRRVEGAEVDPHVEDRERAVATRIAFAIEPADHRGDVRLEEAVTGDEQSERQRERRREHQEDLPERHDDAADEDGLASAVGEEAAEQRREIDEARVEPVDVEGLLARDLEVLRQVQDEERAHPVVREALPGLGAEEDVEPTRVALRGGRTGGTAAGGLLGLRE